MMHNKSFLSIFFILFFLLIAPPLYSQEDSGIANLRQTSKAFASVAKQVSPSVVFIKVESTQQGTPVTPFQFPFDEDLFKRFFGDQFRFPQQQPPQERRIMGQGSGFVFTTDEGIMSDRAYILTNNHVVEGADKISVTLQDSREYEATVKGTDPKSDIAVLEVKADLPALKLGDSSKLEVGEWVIALGNPFGLSHTLTVGVVSAKGRTGLGINDYEDFIQTDAAINPGNSGGPLVNLSGEVIGMNTAIFSRSGGYMGVGFAIPVNLAKSIANQLINTGEVTRGYLGVVIQDLTPDLAESFNLKERQGILIAQVSKDSPASKAGLKTGDLIVAYQGAPAKELGEFRNRVAMTPPGTSAKLTIIRNGKRQTIPVTIGDQKDSQMMAAAPTSTADELGLTVQTLTPDLAEQFNVEQGKGVVVTKVAQGSIAAMAGIRPGTVVLQVNRMVVNTAAEFKQAVDESRRTKRVLLLVSEGGMSRYIVLTLP